MPITIVATPGAANANACVTEAEQIAYMAARLNASAWSTFSGSSCTESEKAAMVEAFRELNYRNYTGRRATDSQAFAWPREMVPDPDSPFGGYYASNVIPVRIKDAACELAFQFVKAGATDVASLDPSSSIRRKKTGPLETEYFEPFTRKEGLARYPRVMNALRPLLASAGPVVRKVRS